MRYVGADLHKDQVTFVVLDEQGSVVLKKRIATKCVNLIHEFLAGLGEPFALAVEAVGFYHWFWDLAEPYAQTMILANAAEVKARFPRDPKTDFRDARRLAELLRLGLFERDHRLRAYVPDPELRILRHLTRRRHNLTRRIAREKISFRHLLGKSNLAGPDKLHSLTGQRWLATYQDKLPPYAHPTAWDLLDAMNLFERQRDRVERDLGRYVDSLDRWRTPFTILTSLPGVGDVVAWTLLAEIGDFGRFDHEEEIVNYVGLDPRTFPSADTCRHGRIAKAGSPDARWVLQEAAWVAIAHDPRCHDLFARIARHAGTKKAAVAVARKLLVWAYHMVRQGQTYRADHAGASR